MRRRGMRSLEALAVRDEPVKKGPAGVVRIDAGGLPAVPAPGPRDAATAWGGKNP